MSQCEYCGVEAPLRHTAFCNRIESLEASNVIQLVEALAYDIERLCQPRQDVPGISALARKISSATSEWVTSYGRIPF